ncbi:MAG: nucleoside monophosphate kinase [Candidatus Absconditabacteria bacterium]|nr:nucleoside monophosphate kinase [Candidatus Absconditabacteria bacterium]MDD3868529.1 nucleoside monophosphate kinase [Candidatus Absconditabacteria bacterium]MDD4714093.1 nucleoside monophosphate kinase [Candidatus Absconditabacteria bacterium]
MKKDLVFFGIQGSGKGTQADLFLEKYSEYKYLEPGQIFRALSSNDNIISQHIKDRMAQGKMLDDNLAFDLFNMYGHLLGDDDHMLTDGFPRSLPQMYYFLSREAKYHRDFLAVNFSLSREKAIERILKRAKEQGRVDDVEESILKRLDVFEKETQPVIDYFEHIGKLIIIDADQSIEVIQQELLEKLAERDAL